MSDETKAPHTPLLATVHEIMRRTDLSDGQREARIAWAQFIDDLQHDDDREDTATLLLDLAADCDDADRRAARGSR